MPIGILGGTFDPIHLGHLYAATLSLEIFQCTKILFLPNKIPPHDKSPITAEHRIEMINISIREKEQFKLDLTEIERPGTSYTIETVQSLRDRFKKDECLIFIMGDDSFAKFTSWKSWDKILDYVNIAIIQRTFPQYPKDIIQYMDNHKATTAQELMASPNGKVMLVQNEANNSMSTTIRQTLKNHQYQSELSSLDLLHQQLPQKVIEYLSEHQLYSKISSHS